jgi:cobalamin biosynthesis protein CobT
MAIEEIEDLGGNRRIGAVVEGDREFLERVGLTEGVAKQLRARIHRAIGGQAGKTSGEGGDGHKPRNHGEYSATRRVKMLKPGCEHPGEHPNVAALFGNVLEERASKDNFRHGEIDDQPSHVDKRRDKGSGSTGGIETTPAEDEREHGAGESAESDDAEKTEGNGQGDQKVVLTVGVPNGLPNQNASHADYPEDDA